MSLLSTNDTCTIDRIAQHILSQRHWYVTRSVSTNSELIEQILTATLPDTQPAILTADSQSGGRGQHGRSWQSPKGNLYFSFYHPLNTATSANNANCLPLTAPITGLLSLCVGHQLANMPLIRQINTHRQQQHLPKIGVKWVNDLGFYQDIQDNKDNDACVTTDMTTDHHQRHWTLTPLQFYKLAGILIEPVQQAGKCVGVVIGIGINVQNPPTLTPTQQEHMGHQAVGLQPLLDFCNLPNLVSDATQTAKAQTAKAQAVKTQTISPQDLYCPVLIACLNALSIHDKLLNKSQGECEFFAEFLHQFAKVDVLADKWINVRLDQHGRDDISNINDSMMLTGRAMGIDRHGCLQVRDDDGKIHALFTGSIPQAFACDDMT